MKILVGFLAISSLAACDFSTTVSNATQGQVLNEAGKPELSLVSETQSIAPAGSVNFAVNTSKKFTLKNGCQCEIKLGGITVPKGVSVTPTPAKLAAGASFEFTLGFSTNDGGWVSVAALNSANANLSTNFSFFLKGAQSTDNGGNQNTGGNGDTTTDTIHTPVMTVLNGTQTLSAGSIVSLDAIGAQPSTRVITARNDGASPFTLAAPSLPAGVSLVTDWSARTLASGQSATFTLSVAAPVSAATGSVTVQASNSAGVQSIPFTLLASFAPDLQFRMQGNCATPPSCGDLGASPTMWFTQGQAPTAPSVLWGSFVVFNTGHSDFNLDSLSIQDPFYFCDSAHARASVLGSLVSANSSVSINVCIDNNNNLDDSIQGQLSYRLFNSVRSVPVNYALRVASPKLVITNHGIPAPVVTSKKPAPTIAYNLGQSAYRSKGAFMPSTVFVLENHGNVSLQGVTVTSDDDKLFKVKVVNLDGGAIASGHSVDVVVTLNTVHAANDCKFTGLHYITISHLVDPLHTTQYIPIVGALCDWGSNYVESEFTIPDDHGYTFDGTKSASSDIRNALFRIGANGSQADNGLAISAASAHADTTHPLVITVTNRGPTKLKFTGLSFAGGASGIDTANANIAELGASLATGESTQITIPLSNNQPSADISITSNTTGTDKVFSLHLRP